MHGSQFHFGDVIVIQGNPGSGKPTLTMVAIKPCEKYQVMYRLGQ